MSRKRRGRSADGAEQADRRRRPSRRRRLLSAALWGGAGLLTVLAFGAGHRLLGGSLPAGLAGLLPVAVAVGGAVAAVTYAVEHRLVRRGR